MPRYGVGTVLLGELPPEDDCPWCQKGWGWFVGLLVRQLLGERPFFDFLGGEMGWKCYGYCRWLGMRSYWIWTPQPTHRYWLWQTQQFQIPDEFVHFEVMKWCDFALKCRRNPSSNESTGECVKRSFFRDSFTIFEYNVWVSVGNSFEEIAMALVGEMSGVTSALEI